MNTAWKIVVVCLVAAAVAGVLVLKASRRPGRAVDSSPTVGLPRLVDLGSVTCIPCKMMAPILEDMKKEFAGRLSVEFIDVAVDRASAARYGIKLIPTQVFFDASGKEIFRHEGFISREGILAVFREKGVALSATAGSAPK